MFLEEENLQGQQEENEGQPAEISVEDEAREMGWVPEEDFKGDKAKWRPASTFVDNARKRLPVANAENKRLQSEVLAARKAIQEMHARMDAREKEGYEKARKELKDQARRAAENADTDGVDKALGELEKLEEKRPIERPKAPDVDPGITQWAENNAWAIKLPKSRRDTLGAYIDDHIADGYSFEEAAEMAVDDLERAFPGSVPNGKKPRTAERVEAGRANYRPAGKTQKGWSDLDEETKGVATQLIRAGVIKDKEEYAKDYFKLFGSK